MSFGRGSRSIPAERFQQNARKSCTPDTQESGRYLHGESSTLEERIHDMSPNHFTEAHIWMKISSDSM